MTGNLIQVIIHNMLLVFGETLIGFTIFILLLRMINHDSKQILVNHGGVKSQLIFGGLGIIIHEASHLVMALIFGHRIDDFKLIKMPHPPSDMTLGYVNHSFNSKNTYQVVGNLFIGIAPIAGCSLAIIGLTEWLIPGLMNNLNTFILNQSPLKMPPFVWWHGIVLIILITNISIGGFDLSRQDFMNSRAGLLTTVIIMMIVIIVATVIGKGDSLVHILTIISMDLYWVLSFALIISMVTNLGLRLILRA